MNKLKYLLFILTFSLSLLIVRCNKISELHIWVPTNDDFYNMNYRWEWIGTTKSYPVQSLRFYKTYNSPADYERLSFHWEGGKLVVKREIRK